MPLVLFLTDGLPTVGNTSEFAIRDVATKANPHGRRIFTFGVGLDVNTPLLERVAASTRAVPTFVLPSENVEVKVGGVGVGEASATPAAHSLLSDYYPPARRATVRLTCASAALRVPAGRMNSFSRGSAAL